MEAAVVVLLVGQVRVGCVYIGCVCGILYPFELRFYFVYHGTILYWIFCDTLHVSSSRCKMTSDYVYF